MDKTIKKGAYTPDPIQSLLDGLTLTRLEDGLLLAQLRSLIDELKAQPGKYVFLDSEFLDAMNQIGEYGFLKHGENSFEAHRRKGDTTRDERRTTTALALHARMHFEEYEHHILHDHFGTEVHQLAAVAYNAMTEFCLAVLENREKLGIAKVAK